MGWMSLLEHRKHGEILEEARVEPIAMAITKRRMDWFGYVKRRDETENIRVFVEMEMEGGALEEDRSCGENTLSEAIGKPGTSGRNGPLTRKDGNASARPSIPHREER